MSKIILNTPKQPTEEVKLTFAQEASESNPAELSEVTALLKESEVSENPLTDVIVDTPAVDVIEAAPTRPPLALAPGQEPTIEVKTTIKDTETAQVQVIKLVFTDITKLDLKAHELNPSDWQVEKAPEQGEDVIIAYNPQSVLRYVGTIGDFNKLLRGTNKE